VKRFLTVLVLACMASVCANRAPGPTPLAGSQPPDTTRLDAYETVIRHLAGSEPVTWEKVYVQIPICANANDAGEPKGCDDALTEEEQASLQQRFEGYGAPLEFIQGSDAIGNRIFTGKEQSVFVWLGPIQQDGADLLVPGSMTCGGLCGTGSTWMLVPDGDGWKVEGSAPGVAVWNS
jgi:hypothetical protein